MPLGSCRKLPEETSNAAAVTGTGPQNEPRLLPEGGGRGTAPRLPDQIGGMRGP